MNVPFLKMNGLGNQIIVADVRETAVKITEAAAVALDGSTKTKFDQIMEIHKGASPQIDAGIRILNSDGSEAGACGNGTRCVVSWLNKETSQNDFTFKIAGGIVTAKYESDALITVDMGVPKFGWEDIPLEEEVLRHDRHRIAGCLMDIEDETGDENLKVLTFGCRLNAYESEVMLRKAREAGLQELDGGSILVNTCAVTGTAVKSAQAAIRRARRENPDARIIVSGCAAQTEAQTFGDMGEVDLVIGNEEKLHAQSYRSLPDFGVNDTEKVAG
ncbi:Diaminopimelate epimerase [Nymphon striatum]|nr:Diaminopimelate epimerase [Nymphon striatum]